jgi:hypothetical protein
MLHGVSYNLLKFRLNKFDTIIKMFASQQLLFLMKLCLYSGTMQKLACF